MPLAICGVHEVPAFAAIPLDHIISFREPHQLGPDIRGFQHPYTLHSFVFADSGSPDNQHAPQEKDVQRLLDIYARTSPDQNILFHCFAGVSRSSAAAFIWLVYHDVPYAQAYETIVKVRGPFVCPNPLIVQYADKLMGHDGKMAAFLTTETGRRADERAAWFEQHK